MTQLRMVGRSRRQFLKAVKVCLRATAMAAVPGGWWKPANRSHGQEGFRAVCPTTGFFPLGVLEDGNVLGGDPVAFGAMVTDIRSHFLDSIFFLNNRVERDASLLDVTDPLGINVFMSPNGDLDRHWWPPTVPADLNTAQDVIKPLVNQLKDHPSLKGYSDFDEPPIAVLDKLALATEAFHAADFTRPTMPILVGLDRVGPIFAVTHPDVMLIDVYPFGARDPIGSFRMSGFGYPFLDVVEYVRLVSQAKPLDTPLWMILQTHSFESTRGFSLRQPTPAEVLAESWLAVGEGATGIFWFIYCSEQGWIGLQDNPSLYATVASFARRVTPLRSTLLGLRRVGPQFMVTGKSATYISTLASPDGKQVYAVVVNRDCVNSQILTVRSIDEGGAFRDLESDEISLTQASLRLAPGDGRVFEYSTTPFVAPIVATTPTGIV